MTRRPTIEPAALWVGVCAACNAAGWILSAGGALDRVGYAVFFAVVGLGFTLWCRKARPRIRIRWRHRRYRRALPLVFATAAFLAILGGVIHPPANYDALAYRLPRVLHWLAEGKWHWIHTDFQRLNTRGAGIEWVSAPLMLFTGSDRLLFLINAVSFLLLPGLTFRLLGRLGVPRRVAWHWMWVLPLGYCFLLQAGSIGNDLFCATLSMVALDHGFRAAREKKAVPAWVAILAAALATAGKGFNLLLGLPLALAMLPAVPVLLRRPLGTIAVSAVALLVSLVPTSILNHQYCGDWQGLTAEPVKLGEGGPLLHLVVNGVLLTIHHLNPTVSPFAGAWGGWVDRTMPDDWAATLERSFEPSAAGLRVSELPMEESSGLGFGIALLLLSVLLAPHRFRVPAHPLTTLFQPRNLVPLGGAAAVLFFLSRSGLGCPDRYLAPFYVLLAAPVLRLPRAVQLTRRRGWRGAAAAAGLLAILAVILTPPRPLWPAQTLLRALGADEATDGKLQRVWTVYSVYGKRADGFAPVRELLPQGLERLGFVTFDDPETSLWRPFGSIRILHVTPADDARSVREKEIEWVLLSDYVLSVRQQRTLDEWLERYDAELTASLDMTLRATARKNEGRWHIARIRAEAAAE